MTFLDRMADLAESWWEATATATPPTAPAPGHRELMRQVAAAVALRVVRPEVGGADPSRLVVAEEVAARLAALQGADGLFSSDGNLHSPPDSAFAINDLGATIAVIDAADDPALAPLRRRLLEIGERALPALLAGGVHTPNHRWEIASALVRLRALDERAVQRAEQWLAEGVDVDADGLYSERSANYAAFVSNPSLLVLAEALVRPDLVEVVHRNLHAQLVLTDADGVVETVFSRRQDQDGAIPLSAFHTQLRRFALAGCETCAAGAEVSEPRTPELAVGALLEIVQEPTLGAELPPLERWPETDVVRHFPGVGMLVHQHGGVRTVVYGGSDVPHVNRIGSGLAGNPTFLRFRAGDAVIRSLRLSRVMFGLGPFRSEGLVVDDGVAHLHERAAARYYQPLPVASHQPDGGYRLTDDGRFQASMAFGERAHDEVELVTDVAVRPGPDGVEVEVTAAGVDTGWSLEIALGEGTVTGAAEVAPEVYRPLSGVVELRKGRDAVVIETSVGPGADMAGWYDPGEAYTFLGGTDALAGPRLYLTGTTPGTWTLTLRRA